MAEKTDIYQLLSKLNDMQKLFLHLGNLLEQVKKHIQNNAFIPDVLNEDLRETLMRIGYHEMLFKMDYLKLDIGEVPNTMRFAERKLLEYQEIIDKKEEKSMIFHFLGLYSDHSEIEEGLVKEQSALAELLKTDSLDQKKIQRIKKFIAAYQEKDAKKKFELTIELSQCFDTILLFGLNTNQILWSGTENNEYELKMK